MDRFNKFLDYIFKVEGGYTNDKNDKGGETKYGITKERARECGYKGNMQDLTKATAQKIYEEKYYKAKKLDQVKNDKMALSIFDFSVNAGRYGIKKAQEAVNKVYEKNVLSVDGVIGPQTLKYLNEVNVTNFLPVYHNLQREYYKSLAKKDTTQNDFLKGWLNRVERKEKFIKEMF
jgi:hypothetical protein|nr:MAG TPA: Lysozyme [Caudoviricetes sp.]